MPRKTISLGSPQYEYDFSNDTSPFENGVGYAIASWINSGDKVSAARDAKLKNDLQTDLTRARINHLNRPTAGKGQQAGQIAPEHVLRELTTKMEGTPSLVYDANGNPTTQYRRAPLPAKEAMRHLIDAGINPKTLRFDPNATMPPDEPVAPAPPDPPYQAAPPAPPATSIAGWLQQRYMPPSNPTRQPSATDYAVRGADAYQSPPPDVAGAVAKAPGAISSAFDSISRALHMGPYGPGTDAASAGTEPMKEVAPLTMGPFGPATAAAPVAPTEDPEVGEHASAIANLLAAGKTKEAAGWIAQMKAEKGPKGESFAQRVKARLRAMGAPNAAP